MNLGALLLAAGCALAQGTLQLSTAVVSGSTFSENVVLVGPIAPAGLQWTLHFDPAVSVNQVASPEATAAGKDLSCNTTQPGTTICVLVGFNQNAIAAGPVAIVTCQASTALNMTDIVASDPVGTTIVMVQPPALLTAALDNPIVTVEDDGLSLLVHNAGDGLWFRASVQDREGIQLWPHLNFTADEPYPLHEIVPHNDVAYYGDPGPVYQGGWAMGPSIGCPAPAVPVAVVSIRAGKFVVVSIQNGDRCYP